ncbi:beta strand repeat-containing protein [Novosphingobium flavum]|nr:Ig-like domain-containing protein [Novosphingobium flavum]
MLLGLLGALGAGGLAVGLSGGKGGSGTPADTTAPSAPTGLALAAADDTGSSNSDRITNQTSALTISGSAEANSTVTILDGTTTVGTATTSSSGTFTVDVALAAGTHSLTATAKDAAGNTSTASAALSITVDTSAPAAPTGLALAAADDTGSSASDGITSQTTALTISGTAEANSSVTLKDGSTVLGTATANGSGAFSLDVALAAGTHSLTATTTDAAGNVGAASSALSITVDTSGPAAPTGLALAAADDTGASSSDRITNLTSGLTITGSAEANAAVVIKEGSTVLGTGTANGSGAFSIDVALAAGSHSLTATATDAAGNVGTASSALAITVDTSAPPAPTGLALAAADDSGASSSDRITNHTSGLTITGTAEANAAVVIKEGSTVLGSGTANGSGAFSIDVALAAGSHSLTATATDVAGNPGSASSALAITVDTTAPTVTVGIDKSAMVGGETATVTFTFSEVPTGFTAADIAVTSGGVTGGTITNLAQSAGDAKVWTATLTPTASTTGPVAVTVASGTFADPAGNASTAAGSASVTYDPGTGGQAIDGYIAGALVFRDGSNGYAADGVWNHEAFTDGNGNGLFDSGEIYVDANHDGKFNAEYNVVTDAQGNFSGLFGNGGIVMTGLPGAIDISTGLAFTGTYTAPNGSTVVTPLTTLVAALVGSGATAADAAAQVKAALGIPAGVDLATFDPFTAAADPATASLAVDVQKASVQVANVLAVVASASAAAGATDGGEGAAAAAIQAIAQQVSGGGVVNLADTATVIAVVQAVADTVGGSVGSALDAQQTALGGSLANVNDAVQQASGASAADALTSLVAAQIVAQSNLAADAASGSLDPANYSGSNLTDQIDGASSQVQQVIPPTTTVPGALAAPDRPAVDPAVGSRVSGAEAGAGVGVTVSYSAVTGLAAGDVLRLYIGDSLAQSYTLTSADLSAGSHAFTLTAAALGDDGGKSLTASFLAVGGTEGARSYPLLLTLDTSSPAPTVDPLSGGLINAAEAAAGVPGSLGAIEVGSGVTITVAGQNAANPAQPLTQSFSTSGKDYGLDPALLAQFADGTLTVSAQQTDVTGNVSATGSTTVVLDRVSQTPTGLDLAAADDTGANNSDNLTKQTSGLTITGTAEAGASVRIMEGATILATTTADGSGQFSADIALSAGAHSIYAASTDVNGNPAASSAPLAITVDTAPPTPPTIQLPEGPIVTSVEAGDGAVITGTVEAGSAVSVILVNGANTITRSAVVTGTSYALTVTSADLATLGEGYVQYKAVAIDAAGNVGAMSLTGQFLYTSQTVVTADEAINDLAALNTFGDGAHVGVTPLAGGGFAVFWTVDLNLDTDTDSIAVQRFAADGAPLGNAVILSGLSPVLAELGDRVGSTDFTALDNGGSALAWNVERVSSSQGFAATTGAGSNGISQTLIVGVPQTIVLGVSTPTAGITYQLRGTGMGGTLTNVAVTPVNGVITITQAILDQFLYDDRLSLVVTGTPGASYSYTAYFDYDRSYDLGSTLNTLTLSGTPVTSGSTTLVSFGSPLGRNESFHLLTAAQPTSVQISITPQWGTGALNVTGLIGTNGITNAIQVANGGIVITFAANAGNVYAVPQAVLSQLADHDAVVNLSVFGLATGTAISVDVAQRGYTEIPEGVFVQTFDANGAATTPATTPIAGAANYSPTENDGSHVIINQTPGGFVVGWSVDANKDGSGETIAFQHFTSAGAETGAPTVLTGISAALLANGSNVASVDVQQLAGGNYALAWATQLEEVGQVRSFTSGGPTFAGTFAMIGRPLEIELVFGGNPAAVYQLRGTGTDNTLKTVTVAMVDGVITVDNAVLANFKTGAALSLLVSGVPQNVVSTFAFHTLLTNHVDLTATKTASVTLSATTTLSVGGPGRTEAIHIDNLPGTPATATMTVRLAKGSGSVNMGLVPVSETTNVSTNADGSIVIKLAVSPTGDYAMPSWLLSQLGDQVATTILTLAGMNSGLSTQPVVTFTYRDLVANPEGVFVQTFDANGAALDPGSGPINTATTAFPQSEDATTAVTALAGGGFVVRWVVDGDGNGEGDGLAVQRFDASGAKVGGVVVLQGLDDLLAPLGDNLASYDLQALNGGGYAVSWTADLPVNGHTLAATAGPAGIVSFALNGVPSEMMLFSAVVPGATYALTGLDENGQQVSLAVTLEADGHLAFTAAGLAAFANVDRLNLVVSGLPASTPFSVGVTEAERAHVDLATPLHSEALVSAIVPGSVGQSGAGSVVGTLNGIGGRIESFHIDQVTYGANGSHQFRLVISTEHDPFTYDLSQVPGATANIGGTITLIVTPDANNNIAVPAPLLAQLGDSDANIFLVGLNLAAGTAFSGTAMVHDMVDNPVGVYTQTFDAAGNPLSLDLHLSGTAAGDLLIGGPGNDTLTGGGGRDVLVGGPGADTFVLDAPAGQTLALADLVSDFTVGTDHLQLSGGLTFGGVHMVQGDPAGNGAAATEALVIANASGDILARLANTDAAAITAASFL